ncbi:MAG TPA: hypothetical protein VLE44_02170, partial [Candidatus Saccharimonadales bacterium]|nr:hypothetical protein [Candidatus Saccharimonadales bacterium]
NICLGSFALFIIYSQTLLLLRTTMRTSLMRILQFSTRFTFNQIRNKRSESVVSSLITSTSCMLLLW